MQLRDCFCVLSTSLIATLFCQSSSAFTLTQRAIPKDFFAVSKSENGLGFTSLNVLDPDDTLNFKKSTKFVTEIERGGTKGLLNDLKI